MMLRVVVLQLCTDLIRRRHRNKTRLIVTAELSGFLLATTFRLLSIIQQDTQKNQLNMVRNYSVKLVNRLNKFTGCPIHISLIVW